MFYLVANGSDMVRGEKYDRWAERRLPSPCSMLLWYRRFSKLGTAMVGSGYGGCLIGIVLLRSPTKQNDENNPFVHDSKRMWFSVVLVWAERKKGSKLNDVERDCSLGVVGKMQRFW